MAKLVAGDDGLPAEEVGPWAKEKHRYLLRYVDICRATRAKYISSGRAGATYIDLFCGPGRAVVEGRGEWIDGSCVAAWKQSLASKTPFSTVYIADADEKRLGAAAERLRRVGAPVEVLNGSAIEAAHAVARCVNRAGLHFAFLDPYSFGALDFQIITDLAPLRIDLLIHISQMDLQRNFDRNAHSLVDAVELTRFGGRFAA